MFGAISNTASAVLGASLAAVVTFGAVSAYVAIVTVPSARENERNIVLGEARERAMDLIKKRSDDDAEISTFDAAQLCVELGGKWVLADNRCD